MKFEAVSCRSGSRVVAGPHEVTILGLIETKAYLLLWEQSGSRGLESR
jgi:hypothetical protein